MDEEDYQPGSMASDLEALWQEPEMPEEDLFQQETQESSPHSDTSTSEPTEPAEPAEDPLGELDSPQEPEAVTTEIPEPGDDPGHREEDVPAAEFEETESPTGDLETPGEPGPSNGPEVDRVARDLPDSFETPVLPVPEIRPQDDPGLEIPSEPEAMAVGSPEGGWQTQMGAEQAGRAAASGGASAAQTVSLELPPGFAEDLRSHIEPQMRDMRSAVMGHVAEIVEDEAVLSSMRSIPE